MATHLHKHIRSVTRKSFERYGFAYAEILSRWREIVGSEFAAFSAPERIRWPRTQAVHPANSRRKLGGTLVIRVTDGRAVELQHETSRIIDRVNTYYGYEAVTAVNIIQGPLPRQQPQDPERPALSPEKEQKLEATVDHIENDDLRAALVRLGRGALSKKSKDRGV